MKQSKYNYILYTNGSGYWYNGLTQCYFQISENLSRKIENSMEDLVAIKETSPIFYEKLLENGFIVPEDIDERDIIRKKYHEAVNDKNYFLVVLPTLNCNFKCWYCIQNHKVSIMKEDTMNALKRHIDYMIEEVGIESLHLDWFGGEPFMFFDQVIAPISKYAVEKCKLKGLPYMTSATTNGYFLIPRVLSQLQELGFRQFQITLDGEKRVHDKVKFTKGCDSAFERVLSNINNMLIVNKNVTLFLRINYTHHNLSMRLVEEVNKQVCPEVRDRIFISPKKVWQESVDKSFGSRLSDVVNCFENSGYKISNAIGQIGFTPCYVNKKYYNAINYNGHIVKCTACNDLYEEKPKGILKEDGTIEWHDDFDLKCFSPSFENPRCLACKELPVCMGLCPKNFLAGENFCKFDSMDEVFEDELLKFLVKQCTK